MKRVLVIGDAILDVYRECSFKKECPDAPGVRAVVQNAIDDRPGGAANVAVNLAALAPTVQVDLIAAVSSKMRTAIRCISGAHVDLHHATQVHSGIVKERIIVDGSFTIRVDNTATISAHEAECVEESLRSYLLQHSPELIVLSDYASGTVSADAMELLMLYQDRLLVDTKMTDLSFFSRDGSRTLLAKLNESEWRAAATRYHSPEEFFRFMVVTCGGNGATLTTQERFGSRSVRQSLPVLPHEVPVADVCGCGDTFLAGLAAAMVYGHDPYTALQFANAAAATVVSKPRTEVADLGAALKLIGRTGL